MDSQREFSGRTALVTGGSNGIGAETAVALAEGGAEVLIHFHTAASDAQKVLKRVQQAGGNGDRRVSLDAQKCWGCGICRSACTSGALSLAERRAVPEVAAVW